MPPFNPAMIGAPSPVGRGGSGPTLVSRQWVTASTTIKVPAGASRATIRAIGQGGSPANNSSYTAGGGGAYARDDIPCSPGQDVVITIGARKDITPAPDGSDGAATTVALSGKTVVAAGGRGGSFGNGAPGGQATDCVGSVKRSGGAAGANNTTNASAGTNGGPGGIFTRTSSTYTAAGGGSAGDIGDTDSLGLGSPGVGNGSTGGPGSGGASYGATFWTGGAWSSVFSIPSGLAVIDFWSA